jgi:hypothetical protein
LADFYQAVSEGADLKLDLKVIEKLRPKIATQLREHAAKQDGGGRSKQD